MRARLVTTVVVSVVVTMGLAVPARAATRYSVVDLGTLGGRTSIANGINAAGQVVGVAQLRDGTGDAFVWSPVTRRMQALGFGPTTFGAASAQGIDDSGRVVGFGPRGASSRAALVWDPEHGVRPLEALGEGSSAMAVDVTGGIVGISYTADGAATQHAFWSAGPGTEAVDLATLPNGPISTALAVNASGEAVGASWWAAEPDPPAWEQHAVLFADGANVDLGVFPGRCCGQAPSAAAYGINDAGQVVGMSSSGDRMWQRAFLWQPSTGLVDLGWLPDPKGKEHSFAYDVNEAVQVVGTSNGRAFLWEGGSMVDLNTLIPKRSGWTLERAHAINDAGWIVGMGTTQSRTHAFLLIPS